MELQNAGIDLNRNTTRGLTPGLVDPLARPNGRGIPIPERWLRPRPQRASNLDRLVRTQTRKRRTIDNREEQEVLPDHLPDRISNTRTSDLTRSKHPIFPRGRTNSDQSLQSTLQRLNNIQSMPATPFAAQHSGDNQQNRNSPHTTPWRSTSKGPITGSRAKDGNMNENQPRVTSVTKKSRRPIRPDRATCNSSTVGTPEAPPPPRDAVARSPGEISRSTLFSYTRRLLFGRRLGHTEERCVYDAV